MFRDFNPPLDGALIRAALQPNAEPGSEMFWLQEVWTVLFTPRYLSEQLEIVLKNYAEGSGGAAYAYGGYFALTIFWGLILPILSLCVFLPWKRYRRLKCPTKKWPTHLTDCCKKARIRIYRTIPNKMAQVIGQKILKEDASKKNKPEKAYLTYTQKSSSFIFCLSTLGVCIVVAFFTTFIISFSVNTKVTRVTTSSDPTSLPTAVKEAIDYAILFINDSFVDGNETTYLLLEELKGNLNWEVGLTVREFTASLLNHYGVTQLFQIADDLLKTLSDVVDHLTWIKDKQTKIFSDLYKFKGVIDTQRRNCLTKLTTICPDMTIQSERELCERIKGEWLTAAVTINKSYINVDTSSQMSFILKNFNLNISQITVGFLQSKVQLDKLLNTIYIQIQSEFNLDSVFGDVASLWSQLKPYLVNVTDIVESVEPKTTDILLKVEMYRAIILALTTLILLCSVVAFIALLFVTFRYLYIRSKLHKQSFQQKKSESVAHILQLSYDEATKPSIEPVPTKLFNNWAIVAGVLFILPTLFAVAVFVAGTVVETEACPYLLREPGVVVSDYHIDNFLSSNWNTWISSLNISFDIPLRFPQPKRVMHALMYRCKDRNQSLLDAVNVRGIVNVTELVEGPTFGKILSVGETYAKQSIQSMDLSSVVPANSTSIFTTATSITEYFDGVSYEQSIRELSEPLVNVSNYPRLVNELLQFATLARSRLLGRDDTVLLLDYAKTLSGEHLKDYNSNQTSIHNLRSHFEALQSKRHTTSTIHQLIQSILRAEATLANKTQMVADIGPIYGVVVGNLKPKVTTIFKSVIATLETQLAKCWPINAAVTTVFNSVCMPYRFTDQLISHSFSFIWMLVAYQFLVVFMWIYVQMVASFQNEPNISEC